MHIAVAICTWNRCHQLRDTLAALCRIRIPADLTWDLVVVNNACTDDTSEVIAAFEGSLPIQEAKEPLPGLSNARNRAIDSARGDYIIFIDDDILVDTEWLAEYAQAIRTHPGVGVLGGSIRPEFEGEPPEWLVLSLPTIGPVFGLSRDLQGEIAPDSPHLPLGGNMGIRADLLRNQRFDPRLGRTAGNLLAGEEAVLLRRLLNTGCGGRWVPTARVRHFIPKRMQTIEHVRRYFHDWGVSIASINPPRGVGVFGRPLWLWRQALQNELLYRARRVAGRPEHWIVNLRWASLAWGSLHQRPKRVPTNLLSLVPTFAPLLW